jgi:hypothetical protein
MLVMNNSTQPRLFKSNNQELFKLGSREVAPNAPEWMMENRYALELREKEIIGFQIVKKPKNKKEELMLRADTMGIIYGDNVTESALEKMIEEKEKTDAKK